jgi:hypothetical protein
MSDFQCPYGHWLSTSDVRSEGTFACKQCDADKPAATWSGEPCMYNTEMFETCPLHSGHVEVPTPPASQPAVTLDGETYNKVCRVFSDLLEWAEDDTLELMKDTITMGITLDSGDCNRFSEKIDSAKDALALLRAAEQSSPFGFRPIENSVEPPAETVTPEVLARRFHEAYERLAPQFGYETRKASAVPWESVPDQNKRLMIAVCAELLALLRSEARAAQTTQGSE